MNENFIVPPAFSRKNILYFILIIGHCVVIVKEKKKKNLNMYNRLELRSFVKKRDVICNINDFLS
jgi:hypothetical protein